MERPESAPHFAASGSLRVFPCLFECFSVNVSNFNLALSVHFFADFVFMKEREAFYSRLRKMRPATHRCLEQGTWHNNKMRMHFKERARKARFDGAFYRGDT